MQAVKIKLYQNMVNYRKEMSYGYVQTYPLPTPSMVKGMAHSLIMADEYNSLKISIQGTYSSVITNMQKVYKFDRYRAIDIPLSENKRLLKFCNENENYEYKSGKKENKGKLTIRKGSMTDEERNMLITFYDDDEIAVINYYYDMSQKIETRRLSVNSNDKNATLNQGLMFVDQIIHMKLVLHISFDDITLNTKLVNAINNNTVVLGRNEDIARIDECKIVDIQSEKERHQNLPFNIFLPKKICDQNNLTGTAYRLPFKYNEISSFADKRIFQFVDVRYISNGRDLFKQKLPVDDEGYPVALLGVDDE